MCPTELTEHNFKKIFTINSLLTLPLLLLTAWPYHFAGQLLEIEPFLIYTGAFLFGFPFTITILHGVVTISVGGSHRDYYYHWLENHPLSYGLFFNPVFISTRFRLILLILSFLLLILGSFNLAVY